MTHSHTHMQGAAMALTAGLSTVRTRSPLTTGGETCDVLCVRGVAFVECVFVCEYVKLCCCVACVCLWVCVLSHSQIPVEFNIKDIDSGDSSQIYYSHVVLGAPSASLFSVRIGHSTHTHTYLLSCPPIAATRRPPLSPPRRSLGATTRQSVGCNRHQ